MGGTKDWERILPTTTETDRDETEHDLDRLFGPALPPIKIDLLEVDLQPKSLEKLDGRSAGHLRHLMKITDEGFGATRYVFGHLPILWIVDRRGDLWFAIEEIVDRATGELVWPRLRHAPVGPSYARLGHPALIRGQDGRIAGEILFDLGNSPPAWFLTNGSGRYGLRAGRKPEHLSNASERFARLGVVFSELFIPPA